MAPTFLSAWWVEALPSNQEKEPEVGFTTLRTMPSVVDFPLPFGPRMPYTFPFSMVKERFFTAVSRPNFLVRLVTVRMVSKRGDFTGHFPYLTKKCVICYKPR